MISQYELDLLIECLNEYLDDLQILTDHCVIDGYEQQILKGRQLIEEIREQ